MTMYGVFSSRVRGTLMRVATNGRNSDFGDALCNLLQVRLGGQRLLSAASRAEDHSQVELPTTSVM